jgi:hypothetical protein
MQSIIHNQLSSYPAIQLAQIKSAGAIARKDLSPEIRIRHRTGVSIIPQKNLGDNSKPGLSTVFFSLLLNGIQNGLKRLCRRPFGVESPLKLVFKPP